MSLAESNPFVGLSLTESDDYNFHTTDQVFDRILSGIAGDPFKKLTGYLISHSLIQFIVRNTRFFCQRPIIDQIFGMSLIYQVSPWRQALTSERVK